MPGKPVFSTSVLTRHSPFDGFGNVVDVLPFRVSQSVRKRVASVYRQAEVRFKGSARSASLAENKAA